MPNYLSDPADHIKNKGNIQQMEYEKEEWKPYRREDYEASKRAFKNMVVLKMITIEEMMRRLRILKEMAK